MKFYNWFLVFILIPFTLQASQHLTQQEIKQLTEERVTNLMIINDVEENYNYLQHIRLLKGSTLSLGAILRSFTESILENNYPILCTKTIWISMQNYIEQLHSKIAKKPYMKFLYYYESPDPIKWLYLTFLKACQDDYICKEVNSDFILFIPRKLIEQAQSIKIQELMLGLSFSNLPDYDYKTLPTDDVFRQTIKDAKSIFQKNILGEILLDAMKKLFIDTSELSTLTSLPQEQSQSLLPFFNIFIKGHGSDTVTAEISILFRKKDANEIQTSDLLQFLQFFNNSVRTKSVTFFSCYPGGKKLLDTFKLTNQFNNINLEQIHYPLIFIGSFFTTIYKFYIYKPYKLFSQYFMGPSIDYKLTKYFNYLNQTPSDYIQAAHLISDVYSPENNLLHPQNIVSIKMPHTSWFTPIKEVAKSEQIISQIEALTSPEIIIQKNTKVVLLSANLIPKIIVKSPNFMLIPNNYHNQNYIIEKMYVDSYGFFQSFSLQSFIQKMFETEHSKYPEENINIIIKELFVKNERYNNIFITFNEEGILSYIYTDPTGSTKSSIKRKAYPKFTSEKSFNPDLLKKAIDAVEIVATKSIKSFDNLEKTLLNTLSGDIPSKILESKKLHEQTTSKESMQSREKSLRSALILAHEAQKHSDAFADQIAETPGIVQFPQSKQDIQPHKDLWMKFKKEVGSL
ncbi:MAG TPA: hypothetical protein VLG50_04855 [Candidatus Saccharimonadales bacterium]|nr:hypothetical protein [Candidatus Saccharimonadales bacterium]